MVVITWEGLEVIFKVTDVRYSSSIIFRVIKSKRMRWAGHVVGRGRGKYYAWFWRGNLRERDHLEDPQVDGRIILRCMFRKWMWGYGLDRSGSE